MSYQENAMHSGQECPATNGNGLQKPYIYIEDIEGVLMHIAKYDSIRKAERSFKYLRNLFISLDAFHDYERHIYDKLEAMKLAEKCKAGRPKGSGADKKTSKAFAYNAGEETNVRLQLLYQGLLSLKWIREDTDMRSFLNMFSGGETTCRVIWTGDINALAELFKELVTRKQLVQLPKGISLWVTVNARFWNKEGNKEFGNDKLRATRKPVENIDPIATLVSLMDPNTPIEGLKRTLRNRG